MFNKVIFLGNLTKNIEIKYSSNGTAIGTSSIDKICTLIHIKLTKLKQKKENIEKTATNPNLKHTIICFNYST